MLVRVVCLRYAYPLTPRRTGSYVYSIAGDSVKSLTGSDASKGRLSLDNEGDEDESAYCVPGVLRANAETVDFASDDIYMDIGR